MANEFIARNGIISKGNLLVTGSLTTSGSLTATGTITATTLVVQTVTSSISSITGSTNFGSLSSNTHTFTGSILASGSVGIGTNNPNQTLHIDGLNTGINLTGGNNRIYFSGSRALEGNGTQIQIGEGHAKTFLQTSTAGTVMTVTGSYVGIGTTSPNDKFVVQSSANVWAGKFIANTTTNDAFGVQIFAGTTSSDTAFRILNAATTSTYMFVRGDGNVGIGTSSPAKKLDVFSDGVQFGDGGSFTFYMNVLSGAVTGVSWIVNNTERLRINTSGFLKASNDGTFYQGTSPAHELRSSTGGEWTTIMTNTASSPYGLLIGLTPGISNTGNEFIAAYVGNFSTLRFKVASNGGIYNYSANNSNLSDIRLKKDITPLESYWNKFKAIEIVKFKYKDQSHDDYNIGVIAQQVEEVAPEFIDADGWDSKNTPEDGIPIKSVYESDLHHATIKVLQEAMARIEQLEAKVIELENK